MTDQNPSATFETAVFSFEDAEGQLRWDRLHSRSPQASPFTTLVYAKSLIAHFGITVNIWFVSDGLEDLIGVLVYSQKKGPFSQVVVPAFTQYTSLLFSPAYHSPEPLTILLDNLATEFDDLRLHFHPSVEDVRPLSWISWQSVLYYTYGIDLSTYDVSKASWSTSTRRNFNKHVAEYTIEENPELLGQCIELCAAGYARNNRTFPTKPQMLYNLAYDLSAQGMIRTFAVFSHANKTDLQAGVVILLYNQSAYYWIAGSNPGPAMTVLIGQVLSELKASGLKHFDFVGANTPSIAEFKRRFGAKLIPYYAGLATPNKVMASILQAKRFFTR